MNTYGGHFWWAIDGNDHALAVIGLIIAGGCIFVVALVALYVAIGEHGLFIDRLGARARFQLRFA
jgi:hypothetical protein